ncbi:MAG: hydrogenase iron-sulfur subunit, partial [Actinobacteria bacterium]
PDTHPAETIDPGIMVVPPRRSDMLERDKVASADAAAMALVLKLSQESITHYRDVSAVDETLCGGCASCVRTCAFGACTLDENGLSHVDIRRCRACGKCVVGCPVGARDIVSSPHDYLLEAVRELADVEAEGDKVLGFLCSGCGYPAADGASDFVAERGVGYPTSFLPLRIPCGGRLDTLYVLEAFKAGFDGVCVYRCREGHCHNLIGNLDMDRRINLLRTVLRSRNIDDARLRIVDISPFEGDRFVESVDAVYSTISTLVNGKGGPQ